jgi:hypothetical protein
MIKFTTMTNMRKLIVLSKVIEGVEILTSIVIQLNNNTDNYVCKWDHRMSPQILIIQYQTQKEAKTAFNKAVRDSANNGWKVLYITDSNPNWG